MYIVKKKKGLTHFFYESSVTHVVSDIHVEFESFDMTRETKEIII